MSEDVEREPRGAWIVVGVLFFAQAVALGVRSTIGLLVKPWEAEFGWERAAISLTASLGFIFYGLAQAASGRWADRLGPRLVLTASLLILGVGTLAVSSIVTLWQAYLIFGVLVMVGVGGASSPTAAVAVARWFTRRRGFAFGVVSGGSGAGQLILLPLTAALVQALGWRQAFLSLGSLVLLVAVPAVFLLLRDDPPGTAASGTARATADGRPLPVAEILRQRNFWWLALSFFVCGVTTAGLIDTHLIPYAQDHHISAVTAASAFGVLSLVNMVCSIASGAVGDRRGHRWLLGWIYAGRAVTLVFLVFARDPVLLFVFAVTFGIVDFSTVAPTTALSTMIFGRRSAGTVFGLVALSHQFGSATGSYVGGVIHDVTGSYTGFFLAGALLSGAAAAMAWAISETRGLPEVAPSAA